MPVPVQLSMSVSSCHSSMVAEILFMGLLAVACAGSIKSMLITKIATTNYKPFFIDITPPSLLFTDTIERGSFGHHAEIFYDSLLQKGTPSYKSYL